MPLLHIAFSLEYTFSHSLSGIYKKESYFFYLGSVAEVFINWQNSIHL